jgi:hypothetical protein
MSKYCQNIVAKYCQNIVAKNCQNIVAKYCQNIVQNIVVKLFFESSRSKYCCKKYHPIIFEKVHFKWLPLTDFQS